VKKRCVPFLFPITLGCVVHRQLSYNWPQCPSLQVRLISSLFVIYLKVLWKHLKKEWETNNFKDCLAITITISSGLHQNSTHEYVGHFMNFGMCSFLSSQVPWKGGSLHYPLTHGKIKAHPYIKSFDPSTQLNDTSYDFESLDSWLIFLSLNNMAGGSIEDRDSMGFKQVYKSCGCRCVPSWLFVLWKDLALVFLSVRRNNSNFGWKR
jgi:hypothetical protein